MLSARSIEFLLLRKYFLDEFRIIILRVRLLNRRTKVYTLCNACPKKFIPTRIKLKDIWVAHDDHECTSTGGGHIESLGIVKKA